ncbi:MAG TPA: S8 family serine peptidase [Dokdonella sp.]|nr:S8 family serine peptidase [Dokdonella sp.]
MANLNTGLGGIRPGEVYRWASIPGQMSNHFTKGQDSMRNVSSNPLIRIFSSCFSLALALCLSVAARSAGAADQLIVVFDPLSPASPSAEDIVASANSEGRDSSTLYADLGYPVEGRLLISETPSPDLAAALAADPTSPRALLQQYVVLTYVDAQSSAAAKALLMTDARVLSVEDNVELSYSTTPNDRYYAFNASLPFEGNYQWGMQAMNMAQAWTIERGHAYIGAIDTGVPCPTGRCSGTTHPDLQQNFRHQFSKNFMHAFIVDTYFDALGHGSHVSGIMAATPAYGSYSNGDSNSGVAGGCWTCSLVMLKAPSPLTAQGAEAVTYAADHGLQAVNMSFGDGRLLPAEQFDACTSNAPQAFCTAIAYASQRDLVMVAASGNEYASRVQWPARESGVIAVGGIEYGNSFWRDGYGNGNACTPGVSGDECGSNYGPQQHIVAPAMDVISTITNPTYNAYVHCGDGYPPELSNSTGYGDCTGTSMAAPHVTALVGLLRSVNPLLSKQAIESILTANTTPCVGADSEKCGNGIPDAGDSVAATIGLAGAINRLTPLFSFYSSSAQDHFYTTVPQMAMAALTSGQLLPQPGDPAHATPYPTQYASIGEPLSLYTQFPAPPCAGAQCAPEATASIFVSHVNPLGGAELVALNRFSRTCFGSSDGYCNTQPDKLWHVYSTSASDASQWLSLGYRLDGIEGYVYPSTIAQPPGTVKLCRAYDSTRHDYALFLGTGAGGTSCTATDGYTGGAYDQSPVSLGWVFSARDSQPICSGGVSCADLTISKTHAGSFMRGQTGATYTIVVGNSGGTATSGAVSVIDSLPPGGLTATAINGSGWTCALGTLTCSRSDSLPGGGSYPPITVTVNVSPSAPMSVVNTATVSGGGDSAATNNSASDATAIVACTSASCGPDLRITKSHTGNFARGAAASYKIVVSNSGAQPTTAAVSVVDALPSGLTATAMSGTGWVCTLGTLTCTRSDILAAGAGYPPITVEVVVAAAAPSSVTNVATVNGGGDVVTSNNAASDVTAIVAANLPDIAVSARSADVSAHASNLSGATFFGVALKVSFTASVPGVAMTAPSSCSADPLGQFPPPQLVASFTCTIGNIGPYSSATLVFSSSAASPGTGIMSVSLVTPTAPSDTNSSNDQAEAAVAYGSSGF